VHQVDTASVATDPNIAGSAATGEFERGTFDIADLVVRQPWQDDVPMHVTTSVAFDGL
jgi:hypothetical protein